MSSLWNHRKSAFAVCLLAAFVDSTSIAQTRDELDAQFAKDLKQIAEICDKYQLEEEAKITRGWQIVRDPARQYLFNPHGSESMKAPADSDSLQGKWFARFAAARKQHAERLYQAAKRKAADDETVAFQWLCEVLRNDPTHREARRVLGFNIPPGKRISVRAGRRAPRELSWRARSFLEINTPNYRIITNVKREQGLELARRLDQLYLVWSQLFFENWARPGVLQRRFRGGADPFAKRQKFEVVFFASREQYVAHLKPWEPRIEISVGYYSDRNKKAYFYASEEPKIGIWYHEATHQLFQESTAANLDVGGKNNFWVVEGIAMYLESLRQFDGYYTVGGFDADRMQFARYRKKNERFYIPIKELVRFGREELKGNEDIRRIYTQSAGLSHFLMDAENGKFRPALRAYLRLVYQKSDTPLSFVQLMGKELQGLDDRYDAFLNVKNSDLQFLGTPKQVRRLCLGHTPIDDRSLQELARFKELKWLDLAYTNVSDAGTQALSRLTNLDQLNLEGTKITNASIDNLAPLKVLTELDLSNTAVDDKALRVIGQLTELTDLWLTGTNITDDGLNQLGRLKKLKVINVEQTKVTAAGLKKLQAMLPQLEK